jgi:hypothetical protein
LFAIVEKEMFAIIADTDIIMNELTRRQREKAAIKEQKL